jgi:hypothetical protein
VTRFSRHWALRLAALAIGAALLASCVQMPPRESARGLAPSSTGTGEATVSWTPPSVATNTPRPRKPATPAPTASPAPTATPDPHRIVITEDDITKAIAAGAGAQQDVSLQNLKVRFAGGKTHITADSVGYGILQMRNLDMVGRLVANGGVLELEVESISPRGLVASLIPSMANQALAQYTAQWYVEEVRTVDGRLELRIR